MVDSEGRKVIVCDNGTGVSSFESVIDKDESVGDSIHEVSTPFFGSSCSVQLLLIN